MNQKNEKGAIVVEATISLSLFIFVIFTILSIVNIYYIQAKMNTAVIYAAKEMSQYSVLYYKSQEMAAATDIQQGIEQLSETVGGAMISSVAANLEDVTEDNVEAMLEHLAPSDIILQLTQTVGETARNGIGKYLAKTLISENLKSTANGSADSFLNFYNVVGGLNGIDFSKTTFLEDNKITIIAEYEVEVMKLLDIDVTYKFCAKAQTEAWGNGK